MSAQRSSSKTMRQKITFVNYDRDPQIGKSRFLKTLVRSHAARVGQTGTRASRKTAIVLRPKYIDLDSALKFEYTPGALQRRRVSQNHTSSSDRDRGIAGGSGGGSSSDSIIQSIPYTSQTTIPPDLMNGPEDPLLSSLPILSREYAPFLKTYYIQNMAVDIPELDLSTPGLLRSDWFPFVLNSPALLTIIFLTAGSHFYNYAAISQDERQRIRRDLLEMKHCAIKLVNTMMLSETEFASDEVILAVGKMASCEALFGNEETFHMHMAGLKLLVHIRGGVDQLGLDGLFARMVCWIDFNAACLLGTTPYLAETAASLPRPLSFQPTSFVGAS